MASGGENWASTLVALDRGAAGAELIAALDRLVGDLVDYDVVDVGGRYLIPRFRHRVDANEGPPRWLAAAQESDGTLRLAGILTALFQQPSPTLLGFEEPELAIHPGALPVLYDFLAEGSVRSQILLTTHSPTCSTSSRSTTFGSSSAGAVRRQSRGWTRGSGSW
jgi:hypothetical protein